MGTWLQWELINANETPVEIMRAAEENGDTGLQREELHGGPVPEPEDMLAGVEVDASTAGGPPQAASGPSSVLFELGDGVNVERVDRVGSVVARIVGMGHPIYDVDDSYMRMTFPLGALSGASQNAGRSHLVVDALIELTAKATFDIGPPDAARAGT